MPSETAAPTPPSPLSVADRHVAAAFTCLLDGKPLLEPLEPANFGPWMGALQAVALAYAAGGQPAAAEKFAQVTKRRFALKRLLAQCAATGGTEPVRVKLSELLRTPNATPQAVVPGLLDTGLTLLAGRPHSGKSWLSLQLALAVAAGGGMRDVKSKVLYLALDDPPWRLQRRLHQLDANARLPLHFATSWPVLDGGGLQCLADEMAHKYRLVVLDTLSSALSAPCLAGPDRIVQVLGRLQTLAFACNAAVLLIDRHTYPRSCDPTDTVAPTDPVELAFEVADRCGLFAKTITLARAFGEQGAALHLSDYPHPIYLARHPEIKHETSGTQA
jgi:hypothetical protein